MTTRCRILLFLWLAASLLATSCSRGPEPQPKPKKDNRLTLFEKDGKEQPDVKEEKPEPKDAIDPQIVADYAKIGGKYGGFIDGATGGGRYFERGRHIAERGLPGFQIWNFPKAKLPEVPIPFGLDLSTCENLTNADLKQIAALKNLTELDLFITPIGDAGVKELTACADLVELNLHSTEVTDAGLKHIRDIKKLHTLYIKVDGRKITDTGIKELASIDNLKTLHMTEARVFSAKVPMPAMEHLTTLYLMSNDVRDDRMKGIAGFKNLKELGFYDTNITDATLKELAQLKTLTLIKIYGISKVTDAGVEELRKALPECIVLNTSQKN